MVWGTDLEEQPPSELDYREQLADARKEIERLKQAVAAGEETIAFLRERYVTLLKIEQGGWWRLRMRIIPLVRAAGVVRRRLRGLSGADESPLS